MQVHLEGAGVPFVTEISHAEGDPFLNGRRLVSRKDAPLLRSPQIPKKVGRGRGSEAWG